MRGPGPTTDESDGKVSKELGKLHPIRPTWGFGTRKGRNKREERNIDVRSAPQQLRVYVHKGLERRLRERLPPLLLRQLGLELGYALVLGMTFRVGTGRGLRSESNECQR